MSRYTVLWDERSEASLTEIWLRASDRSAITEAVDVIDRQLSSDPIARGEDFYGDWMVTHGPLAVIYIVYPLDGVVKVVGVWAAS